MAQQLYYFYECTICKKLVWDIHQEHQLTPKNPDKITPLIPKVVKCA